MDGKKKRKETGKKHHKGKKITRKGETRRVRKETEKTYQKGREEGERRGRYRKVNRKEDKGE